MSSKVILSINSNQGYAPDQVADKSITLADLLQAVQDAVEEFGGEARVVLDEGGRYGANFGYLSQWEDLFTDGDATDCGECGEPVREGDETCPNCGFPNE